MSSDLLFYVLPRLGRVPFKPEDNKVQKLSKEAILRPLNDEEKELSAEEFQARTQSKKRKEKEKEGKGKYYDEEGHIHYDNYA